MSTLYFMNTLHPKTLHHSISLEKTISPKTNSRVCNHCGFRHAAPTWKKCRRQEEDLKEDLSDIFGNDIINPGVEEANGRPYITLSTSTCQPDPLINLSSLSSIRRIHWYHQFSSEITQNNRFLTCNFSNIQDRATKVGCSRDAFRNHI